MTIKEFFSFRKNGLFWGNIIAMVVVLAGVIFGVLAALDAYTRHGEAVVVPDVKGLSLAEAQTMFADRGLNCVVADALDIPLQEVPDVADNSSVRQAEARLLAAGFRLTNNDSIPGEKDWVYAVKYRGNSLEIGAKVPMGAILTLVIGNGEEAPADSLQVDSLDVPQVQGEVLEEEDWF